MANKQNIRLQTPEQLEYEELTKKLRSVTAKLRISQEGVNVSSISKQKLDMVMRIFDEMEQIQRESQQKTSKIQQDANIQTQKVNQDAGKKFGDIQKRYQELIKSLKDDHPKEQEEYEELVVQPIIEKDREKTHEEKVAEITDIVLREMRDSVYSRIDEIMKTVDTRAGETIGGTNIEEIVDNTKQTTVDNLG